MGLSAGPPQGKTRLPRGAGSDTPAANVPILAFASRLAVGAKGHDVHLAFDTRAQVLVRPPPGVVGELFQVRLPVDGRRAGAGARHQRLQALLGRRIALVVQAVELERLHEIGHVGARRHAARVVGAVEHVGDDQCGQHADDHQHHHQLDQGETGSEAPACGSGKVEGEGHECWGGAQAAPGCVVR